MNGGATEATQKNNEQAEPDRTHKPRALGLILTFVVAAVGLAVVAVLFHTQTYKSPAGTLVATRVGSATVNGQTLQHVTLAFNTYPDASGTANGKPVHPGGNPSWPTYGPTNQFQVPAHALVTVTIHQYDSGGSLNNSWFATVRGTLGNVARVNGRVVHAVNPNDVGHTFTVRGAPGTDPGFFVSVPLPEVPGNNQSDDGPYETVVFSFISGSKGIYAWNCEYPCGTSVAGFGGPMSVFGYMSGFLHVV
jgi:hypothetical protein